MHVTAQQQVKQTLQEIIKDRRSVRRYQDRPVPREVLERLLEMAIWAPSAHNRQPWRFACITVAETQRALAAAMAERLRADRMADGTPLDVIEADAARSFTRISTAPALILVSLSMADMDHYPDAKRAAAETLMAAQSTAMAVQNLLLAAQAEGLGACWMCAPLFCPDIVAEVLALPADWQPQALLTLGYPAVARPSTRLPFETRTIWR